MGSAEGGRMQPSTETPAGAAWAFCFSQHAGHGPDHTRSRTATTPPDLRVTFSPQAPSSSVSPACPRSNRVVASFSHFLLRLGAMLCLRPPPLLRVMLCDPGTVLPPTWPLLAFLPSPGPTVPQQPCPRLQLSGFSIFWVPAGRVGAKKGSLAL